MLGLQPNDSPTQALMSNKQRAVLLVDTYELLCPLENWLREEFLPELPESMLIVFAGREPPVKEWLSDPGWQTLLRVVSLRNLAPEEGREYLKRRNIPETQISAVLDFTHGHPLALSLVADSFDQRSDLQFKPEAAPDMVKTLLEQFVQKLPGPAHRAALEASALVRVTTESILAAMLNLPDPPRPRRRLNPARKLRTICLNGSAVFPLWKRVRRDCSRTIWRGRHYRGRAVAQSRLVCGTASPRAQLLLETIAGDQGCGAAAGIV